MNEMGKRSARIYRPTPRNLARLAAHLRSGEIVAVPTETVYGLAADAFDARACRRIFAAKGRPASDPLIVHIHAMRELEAVAEANPEARRLAKKFWPGPLTLILPKKRAVPDVVTAGRPSVAVRMPSHPVLRRLLKLTRRPIAAPSANPFGYVSPTTAEHVRHGLGMKIRHILDGGPARIGLESTIVDLRDPESPVLLRPGAITRAALRRILRVPVISGRKRVARAAQLAPGQLPRHYSPHTPIVLHRRIDPRLAARGPAGEAWLFVARPEKLRGRRIHWLDAKGDLARAGRRLFAAIRKLDRAGYRRIHVEQAPGGGLADAINDRLRRAAFSAPRARAHSARRSPP